MGVVPVYGMRLSLTRSPLSIRRCARYRIRALHRVRVPGGTRDRLSVRGGVLWVSKGMPCVGVWVTVTPYESGIPSTGELAYQRRGEPVGRTMFAYRRHYVLRASLTLLLFWAFVYTGLRRFLSLL